MGKGCSDMIHRVFGGGGARRVGFVCALMVGVVVGWGQKVSKAHKIMCPLRGAIIRVDTMWNRSLSLEITETDSVVLAVRNGRIQSVFSMEDIKAVMIKSGKLFYTYSNLDTVFVAKGDSVVVGQTLGVVNHALGLVFVISNMKGGEMWGEYRRLGCR